MYKTCGSASKEDVQRLFATLVAYARQFEAVCHQSSVPGHLYFSASIDISRIGAECDVAPVIGAWHDEVAIHDPEVYVVSDCLNCSQLAAEEGRLASEMLAASDRLILKLTAGHDLDLLALSFRTTSRGRGQEPPIDQSACEALHNGF